MTQHQKPCATCPFRRTTEAGYLGGSPVETFIGQIEAGFMIYCHECIDYEDPDWQQKASRPGYVAECAGAAVFRSNIHKQRDRLLTLPADREAVFASHEEFLAHHAEMPLDEARHALAFFPPALWARLEMGRAGVVVTPLPAKGQA